MPPGNTREGSHVASLAARELYVSPREGRVNECTPKLLRGRKEKLENMKCHILHLVASRQQANSYVPFNDCAVTHA